VGTTGWAYLCPVDENVATSGIEDPESCLGRAVCWSTRRAIVGPLERSSKADVEPIFVSFGSGSTPTVRVRPDEVVGRGEAVAVKALPVTWLDALTGPEEALACVISEFVWMNWVEAKLAAASCAAACSLPDSPLRSSSLVDPSLCLASLA